MKKLITYAALILTTGIVLAGCYKDVILPDAAIDPDGPPQAVSFNTELKPLLNSSCGAMYPGHINLI
jgi:hypothetical protein